LINPIFVSSDTDFLFLLYYTEPTKARKETQSMIRKIVKIAEKNAMDAACASMPVMKGHYS